MTIVMTIVIKRIIEEIMSMKTIKASEFKARCLQLMDEVAKSGEPLLITKNGKPVSQLVPYRPKPSTLFGAMKGTVTIQGDILSPLYEDWEALR
jgi:prevent-host-death family protein